MGHLWDSMLGLTFRQDTCIVSPQSVSAPTWNGHAVAPAPICNSHAVALSWHERSKYIYIFENISVPVYSPTLGPDSLCPICIAGVPFDSCQEHNGHLITGTTHSYSFSTSREGQQCSGFTNKQTYKKRIPYMPELDHKKTANMDGLYHSPHDPYYKLRPVYTGLCVRVRETGDWDLFLGPLLCVGRGRWKVSWLRDVIAKGIGIVFQCA